MEVPKHVIFGLETALKNHYPPDKLGRVLIDLLIDAGFSLFEIQTITSTINTHVMQEHFATVYNIRYASDAQQRTVERSNGDKF